jgi:hypothetical protein
MHRSFRFPPWKTRKIRIDPHIFRYARDATVSMQHHNALLLPWSHVVELPERFFGDMKNVGSLLWSANREGYGLSLN